MEKQETGKIITIKINGKKQEFEGTRQQPIRNIDQPLEKKKAESSKIPIEELDEMKSLSAEAAAAAQEDESFDWILPETSEKPEIKEFHIASTVTSSQKKKSKQKGSPFGNSHFFKTIFIAVFLAVILGTSFGFIMLKLVLTESSNETTSIVPTTETETEQTETDVKTPAGTNSLTLPKISAFVVQGGAFSSKESAEKEQQSLQAKGTPAQIIESDGKSLLLLSVADNSEQANKIEARFDQTGMDTFDKALNIGGKELTGLQEKEKELIAVIPLLFQTIAAAGANASLNTAIPQPLIESIDQQAKKIIAIEENQLSNDKIKSLKASTEKAVKQVKTMKSEPNAKDISALQQNLLSILAAYDAL